MGSQTGEVKPRLVLICLTRMLGKCGMVEFYRMCFETLKSLKFAVSIKEPPPLEIPESMGECAVSTSSESLKPVQTHQRHFMRIVTGICYSSDYVIATPLHW